MKTLTIGIRGGMGSYAPLDFYKEIPVPIKPKFTDGFSISLH